MRRRRSPIVSPGSKSSGISFSDASSATLKKIRLVVGTGGSPSPITGGRLFASLCCPSIISIATPAFVVSVAHVRLARPKCQNVRHFRVHSASRWYVLRMTCISFLPRGLIRPFQERTHPGQSGHTASQTATQAH